MTTPIVVNDEVDELVVFYSSISNKDASLKFAQIISKLNYKSPLINTCVKMFNCHKLQVRFPILNYTSYILVTGKFKHCV
jgi:hypothetical protein